MLPPLLWFLFPRLMWFSKGRKTQLSYPWSGSQCGEKPYFEMRAQRWASSPGRCPRGSQHRGAVMSE